MTTAEKIFNLIEAIGECLKGSLHIIDTSDEVDTIVGEKQYRVYSNEGWCFDVKKVNEGVDDNGVHLGWYYSLYQEWEGFIKAEPLYILKELEYYKKGLR